MAESRAPGPEGEAEPAAPRVEGKRILAPFCRRAFSAGARKVGMSPTNRLPVENRVNNYIKKGKNVKIF